MRSVLEEVIGQLRKDRSELTRKRRLSGLSEFESRDLRDLEAEIYRLEEQLLPEPGEHMLRRLEALADRLDDLRGRAEVRNAGVARMNLTDFDEYGRPAWLASRRWGVVLCWVCSYSNALVAAATWRAAPDPVLRQSMDTGGAFRGGFEPLVVYTGSHRLFRTSAEAMDFLVLQVLAS